MQPFSMQYGGGETSAQVDQEEFLREIGRNLV